MKSFSLVLFGVALLLASPLRAQPVACKACVTTNGAGEKVFVVQWCNTDPTMEYVVFWSDDPMALKAEPLTPARVRAKSIDPTKPSFSISMAGYDHLFFRLVEYPPSLAIKR